jgi:cytochrome c-type biogenesis protein CcmF
MKMNVGDTAAIGHYVFTFRGVEPKTGPNYQASRGTVDITRDGKAVTTLHPEKRVYNASSMPMTEAAIDAGITGDLYVSLGEPLADGAWAVRIYHKPFVDWIWGGAVMMALGGLLALSDRRYRIAAQAAKPAQAPILASAGSNA